MDPFTLVYRQVEPYVYRLVSSDYPIIELLGSEVHFRMENGKPSVISFGNGQDMSSLPEGRSLPILIGSVAVIAVSSVFFLFMPVILLITLIVRLIRKRKIETNRFHKLSTGLLLCGTALTLNNVIILIRLFVINMYRPFSEILPHIWVNYALLVISAGFLAATALSLKGSGVKPRRKLLYGTTVALLAMSAFVFWVWNFFTI